MCTARLIGVGMFCIIAAHPQVNTAPAGAVKLNDLRRLCVEKFAGEEPVAAPVREIAIAALFSLRQFSLTENCARADATLKGAVLERNTRRVRGEGESTGFGAVVGGVSATRANAVGAIAGASGLADEQLYSAETGTTASVTLRLVTADGDVLWAYTQDSSGGKTKGAIADAIERAVKQLTRELNRTGPSQQ